MKFSKALALTLGSLLICSSTAFAEAAGAGVDWTTFAKAIGFGLAALAAATGQGRTASAAMEAIGRNPGASGEIKTPMIIGLALMESIALFGLVLAFTI